MTGRTIVSFHAHPDDEALLTGGTLALLADAGHRVVLVVATSGAAGLTDGGSRANRELGDLRLRELEQSASALGCQRVVHLGYGDSGWAADGGVEPLEGAFSTLPIDVAAAKLAAILREEDADILTVYDRHGGYGHADHVRVHDVGVAAARLAGTDRVLAATVDRTLLRRAVRVLQVIRLLPAGTATDRVDSWYTARDEITHRIPVRRVLKRKRAALAAHRSQAVGGDGPRTAKLLLRLPAPLFALVCGREWFIELGAPVPPRPLTDLLLTAAANRTTVAA